MKQLAYSGKVGCTSVMCRRIVHTDGTFGPCMGWHCAVCDEPSSQQGHASCHQEDGDA